MSECKCEFIRCTNVDFPAPAIPMVMITIGFFLDVLLEGSMMTVVGRQVSANYGESPSIAI